MQCVRWQLAMSVYRSAMWLLKGVREFTRGGFDAASKRFEEMDTELSVVGRSFMITGANSGIGKAAALAVARRGGTVHMVCRNRERAEQARGDIIRDTGNKEVYIHILDMANMKKVLEFAESFKKKHKSLNVLVNNAGCMVKLWEQTSEGLEKNFATNTLGVYLLTSSLIPLLERSSDPRVITVSSGGMLVQKLQTGDLQPESDGFDGTVAYTQNKRQQVVMTEQWAKLHPKIHFSVMHPGWVDTPAVAMAMPEFHQAMREQLRSPEQGADTVAWLAICPAVTAMPSGRFFQDRKMVPAHLPLAWTRTSQEEEQRFMVRLEELCRSLLAH